MFVYGMLSEDAAFEWETEEDLLNRINGVFFAEAKRVFEDPEIFLDKDRVGEETGEQRWHAIGVAQNGLLLVVHVYRVETAWHRKNQNHFRQSR